MHSNYRHHYLQAATSGEPQANDKLLANTRHRQQSQVVANDFNGLPSAPPSRNGKQQAQQSQISIANYQLQLQQQQQRVEYPERQLMSSAGRFAARNLADQQRQLFNHQQHQQHQQQPQLHHHQHQQQQLRVRQVVEYSNSDEQSIQRQKLNPIKNNNNTIQAKHQHQHQHFSSQQQQLEQSSQDQHQHHHHQASQSRGGQQVEQRFNHLSPMQQQQQQQLRRSRQLSDSPSSSSRAAEQSPSNNDRSLHVNFNRHNKDSDEPEAGESRKKKYLTAKYGQQQMNLIKKRLKIEMWLFEQLQELAKGSKSEVSLTVVNAIVMTSIKFSIQMINFRSVITIMIS